MILEEQLILDLTQAEEKAERLQIKASRPVQKTRMRRCRRRIRRALVALENENYPRTLRLIEKAARFVNLAKNNGMTNTEGLLLRLYVPSLKIRLYLPSWTNTPQGGWLKDEVITSGYADVMMLVNLPPARRKEIFERWSGYTLPILVQNSKTLAGSSSNVFDSWKELDRVERILKQAVDHNIKIILFLASDKDARERGINRLMNDLAQAWGRWGMYIAGVCPRIEIGEEHLQRGDYNAARQQAEVMGKRIREIIGPDVPLWLHFNHDIILIPDDENYTGLLYQFKRVGDDGVTLRGGHEYHSELASPEALKPYPRSRPQDRVTFSPADTCKKLGLDFVAFEMTPMPNDTVQDWEDCKEGATSALRKLNMPEYYA